MRFLASLLLAALIGTGYSGPMHCCDHGPNDTSDSTCHQVPAPPMRCHEIWATGCADVCEPERAIALTPARVLTEAIVVTPLLVTQVDRHTPRLLSSGATNADQVDGRPASGRLYLLNRVLLI